MNIISYIPGRIRFRDNSLAQAEKADQITALFKSFSGITAVSVNMKTASLLVQYDPASGVEELLCKFTTPAPISK